MSNSASNTTTALFEGNGTTVAAHWGYIGLLIAVLFFGSNYVPVKKFETGDGMFFQLVLCIGIWIVGFFVQLARNFPTFHAFPMIGGVFWSFGNINTVPIIKCIGLGMGVLIWSTVSLVTGWAVARFGLFGINPQQPTNPVMNYIGVVFAAISTIFYLFVKTDVSLSSVVDSELQKGSYQEDKSFIDRLDVKVRRIVGISLSCFSGILYGVTSLPYLYVMDNYDGASQNGLDYTFPIYTGILVSSVFYFTIYSICKRNRPNVYPQAMLPGLLSGIMWGIANSGFYVANSALSQAIAFPIVASGPSVIASLYGIFLFKEISGRKNFLILALGFIFAIAGAILSGLSK